MSTGPTTGPPAGPRPGGGGAGGVAAFARRNKVGLGVAAVAGVAGLALVRSKTAGSSSGPKTAAYTDRVAATGQAQYDSSSSDVYNALQPALESVSNQYDELLGLLRGSGSTPLPVPTPGGGAAATPDLTVPDAAPRPSTAVAWSPTVDETRGVPSNWSTDAQSVANRDTARADTSQSWSNGFLGVNPIIDWSKFSTSSSTPVAMSASEAAQRERDRAAGW